VLIQGAGFFLDYFLGGEWDLLVPMGDPTPASNEIQYLGYQDSLSTFNLRL